MALCHRRLSGRSWAKCCKAACCLLVWFRRWAGMSAVPNTQLHPDVWSFAGLAASVGVCDDDRNQQGPVVNVCCMPRATVFGL